jgi:hypothetical protein
VFAEKFAISAADGGGGGEELNERDAWAGVEELRSWHEEKEPTGILSLYARLDAPAGNGPQIEDP